MTPIKEFFLREDARITEVSAMGRGSLGVQWKRLLDGATSCGAVYTLLMPPCFAQAYNAYEVRLNNAMQGVSRLRPVAAQEKAWRVGTCAWKDCAAGVSSANS